MASQSHPQPAAVRVRSPNYPVIALAEAIQKVRAIYDQEHIHPADRKVLAKVLGYASLNGASVGVISALAKYGLMEGAGDSHRVSEDARTLIVQRRGDPEYSEAIRRTAFQPSLFRELHEHYGGSLPSDHNLRVYLQKKGFNPKSLDSVVRVYRDTLEFVESETEGNSLPEICLKARSQTVDMHATASGQFAETGDTRADVPSKVIELPLSEVSNVRIVFTGRVTQDDIAHIIAVLNLNKRAYPKAGDDPLRQHSSAAEEPLEPAEG
ncbi:MAG: hypothetical protein ACRDIY_05965 [Chloroflexota bacterium]